jgi:hypothetical protein
VERERVFDAIRLAAGASAGIESPQPPLAGHLEDRDALVAHVSGTLRGARTIAIEPRGDDGYFVQMELDADYPGVTCLVRQLEQ